MNTHLAESRGNAALLLAERLSAAFVAPLAAWWRARARTAAVRDLQRLSDHQLRDIGVERGEIVTLVAAMQACEEARAGATGDTAPALCA